MRSKLLQRFAITLLGVGALGLAVWLLPLKPLLGNMQWIQTPIAVLVVVCGLGKLLYDTLFFDRYV